MEPARFWVREDVYYTYACRSCEEETDEANIRKTPKQPTLCPGSFASAEAVAHIMVQKSVMYSLGAGISAARAETVPADHGQLGAKRLGYLAAPDL